MKPAGVTFGDFAATFAGGGGVRGFSTLFLDGVFFVATCFFGGVGTGPVESLTLASLIISKSGLLTPSGSLKNVKLSIVNSLVFTAIQMKKKN